MNYSKNITLVLAKKLFSETIPVLFPIFSFIFFMPQDITAATWNLDGDGNWNNHANWISPELFPNGTDAKADFTDVISQERTISLGQDITIGNMTFDSPYTYKIAPGNSLKFESTQGNAQINVEKSFGDGSSVISSNMILNSNVSITQNSQGSLTLTGPISGNGSLIFNGPGILDLNPSEDNTYTGNTYINNGKVHYESSKACIPENSLVVVGDGTHGDDTVELNINAYIEKGFRAIINSDGIINQNTNQMLKLIALEGNGEIYIDDFDPNDPEGVEITGLGPDTLFSGIISGGMEGSIDPDLGSKLNKAGPAVWTLKGNSSYICPTIISGGAIKIQSNNALGASGPKSGVYVLNEGSLEIDGDLVVNKYLFLNGHGRNAQGALYNSMGHSTITEDVNIGWVSPSMLKKQALSNDVKILTKSDTSIGVAADTSLTLTGSVTGDQKLTKKGKGELILAGSTDNTCSGEVVVEEGCLVLDKEKGKAIAGDVIVKTSAKLLTQKINQFDESSSVILDGGTFDLNQNTQTIGSLVLDAGELDQKGALLLLKSKDTALKMKDTTVDGDLLLDSDTGSIVYDASSGTAYINGTIDLGGKSHAIDVAKGTEAVDLTITGLVCNGNIDKKGKGTLVLKAENATTGQSTISDGTLQGDASSIPSDIDNESILVFDQTDNATYDGTITGEGSIIKQGEGTLILAGENTSTGPIIVTEGTLEGDTNTLPGTIINDATVVFNQQEDGVYQEPINGSGSLIKEGESEISFSEDITQEGGLYVNEGTVFLNKTLDTSGGEVYIAPDASLKGTDTIYGDVEIEGAVKPGHSINTLPIVGDVNFATGSIYEVEFSQTEFDLLDVTGHVTIQPGSTVLLLALPMPLQSVTLPIIQTTEGLTGTFDYLHNPYPLLAPTLHYTIDDLFLQLDILPFTHLFKSGNVGNIAHYLDTQNLQTGTDLYNVVIKIKEMTTNEDIQNALEQLHPALFHAYALSQENIAIRQRTVYTNRLWDLMQTDCSCKTVSDHSNSLWLDAIGDFYHQDEIHDYSGFYTKSQGLILGYDKIFNSYFTSGLSGSYMHSNMDWDNDQAKSKTNSYSGAFYASFFSKPILAEASIIGAYNQSKANRRISFSTIDRVAAHKQNSHLWNAHLGLIGCWTKQHTTFSPFIFCDYLKYHQNRFTETGADDLNLLVKKQNADLWRLQAGLKLSTCIEIKSNKILPSLSLSYVQEIRNNGSHSYAQLMGAENFFWVKGLNPDRNLFAPEAKLIWLSSNERWSLSLGYAAEIGSKFWDQNLIFQAAVHW
jgi:autotransporter-associated beta strand protein